MKMKKNCTDFFFCFFCCLAFFPFFSFVPVSKDLVFSRRNNLHSWSLSRRARERGARVEEAS